MTMSQQTFTHYWVTKKGEGVIAGPLADRGYAETVLEGFDDRTDLAVVELVPLWEYPLPTYIGAETVSYVEHQRARVAGSGGALAIRLFADTIHCLASKAGPDFEGQSDYLLAREVHDLCDSLITTLSYLDHGWDNGTVDEWARGVAAFVGEGLE
jgi:hypothetical protein